MCGSGAVVCSLSLLIRWAQRARCQAETPLIVLFRFLRPALTTVVIEQIPCLCADISVRNVRPHNAHARTAVEIPSCRSRQSTNRPSRLRRRRGAVAAAMLCRPKRKIRANRLKLIIASDLKCLLLARRDALL